MCRCDHVLKSIKLETVFLTSMDNISSHTTTANIMRKLFRSTLPLFMQSFIDYRSINPNSAI